MRHNKQEFQKRKAWAIAFELGWHNALNMFMDIPPEVYETRGKSKHYPTPFASGGKDGFRYARNFDETGGGFDNTYGAFPNGFKMIAAYVGCQEEEAYRLLIDKHESTCTSLNIKPKRKHVPKKTKVEEMSREEKISFLNGVLASSYVNPMAFFKYMQSRGVQVPQEYMPHNTYWNSKIPVSHKKNVNLSYPGLVFAITNKDNIIVSAHRIFTENGARATSIDKAKMLMPSPDGINGALIRGYPVYPKSTPLFLGKVRGFTEGAEDMVCCTMSTKVPCCAGISSTIMMNADFEDSFDVGIIFADDDEAGHKSAYHLSTKLMNAGKKVIIYFPSQEGNDWNDMLKDFGPSSFPKVEGDIDYMRKHKYKISIKHPFNKGMNWKYLKNKYGPKKYQK